MTLAKVIEVSGNTLDHVARELSPDGRTVISTPWDSTVVSKSGGETKKYGPLRLEYNPPTRNLCARGADTPVVIASFPLEPSGEIDVNAGRCREPCVHTGQRTSRAGQSRLRTQR
ncbi:MAG TPA: hypothetical protein VN924_30840 [Bryobacteraceae bacterium]|nr:hypothetical protein [Bryobacteraceae bacterium]